MGTPRSESSVMACVEICTPPNTLRLSRFAKGTSWVLTPPSSETVMAAPRTPIRVPRRCATRCRPSSRGGHSRRVAGKAGGASPRC